MAVHPSMRVLSILLRPSNSSDRDDELLILACTGTPSGGVLANGDAMAAGQAAICYQTDAATLDALEWRTIDGGTTWTQASTLVDLELSAATAITVAAGVATATQGVHTVTGAGGAPDDVDTISGLSDAEIAILVTGAFAITYRDAAVGGGNIALDGDTSLVTATGDVVMAVRSGSVIRVVPIVMTAGRPVGSLALARGSAIVGDSSAQGSALDISAAGAIAQGDGTDAAAVTLPAAGLLAKTAATTWAGRTITGTANQVSVSNGDGVAGNPTLSTPQDIATTSSPTFASMRLTGDLVIQGDSIKADLETIELEGNWLVQNTGYATVVAQMGGRALNVLPTATVDTTAGAGVVTAGVLGVSDATITTDGAATFAEKDIVQITGSENYGENDGWFEVLSHAANLLTLKGQLTPTVLGFSSTQLVANAADTTMSIRKIAVAVDRAGTDGRFEAAYGSDTDMVFSDYLLVSDIGSQVQAYDADLAAVAALAGTGFAAHTGAGTWAERTIVPGGGTSVSNGNGVSANPSISVTKSREMGSVPVARLLVPNQPADGDTIAIGADTYEFVDTGVNTVINNDAHIGVVIGVAAANTRANLIDAINGVGTAGASVTLADTVTPCLDDGTVAMMADEIGTTVRVRYADGVGGTPLAGDPNIALVQTITDAADVWDVGDVNMNTLGGGAAGYREKAQTSLTVTAEMITSGARLDFPFTVAGFRVQVRTGAGVIRGNGTDAYTLTSTGIAIAFGGGAAPDAQATDILDIEAWSATA